MTWQTAFDVYIGVRCGGMLWWWPESCEWIPARPVLSLRFAVSYCIRSPRQTSTRHDSSYLTENTNCPSYRISLFGFSKWSSEEWQLVWSHWQTRQTMVRLSHSHQVDIRCQHVWLLAAVCCMFCWSGELWTGKDTVGAECVPTWCTITEFVCRDWGRPQGSEDHTVSTLLHPTYTTRVLNQATANFGGLIK